MAVKLPNLVTPETFSNFKPVLFLGVESNLVDEEDVKSFENLESLGTPRTELLESTGLFRGGDGVVRRELGDDKAGIFDEYLSLPTNKPHKLSTVLDHPELYEAYPELDEEVYIIIDDTLLPENYGYYDPGMNVIGINPSIPKEDIFNTIIHETQHAIQGLEGMSLGGNTSEMSRTYEYMRPLLDKEFKEQLVQGLIGPEEQQQMWDEAPRFNYPEGYLEETPPIVGREAPNLDGIDLNDSAEAIMEMYMRLGGEVEARNVDRRQYFTEEDRVKYPPWVTVDRSEETQQHRPRIDYNEGGLVSSVTTDYKKVERGDMTESDFQARYGQSTKMYEDDFMDQYGIDLVNIDEFQTTQQKERQMRGLVRKNFNNGGMVVDDIVTDPVSGNPVPVGSAPEEVRDDVEANLSEGEFVIPANVVQYYGVKYFDGLINKAEEKLESVPQGEPDMAASEEMNYNEGGMVLNPNTPPAEAVMQESEGYGYKTFYGPNGQVIEVMFLAGQPQTVIPAGYSPTPPVASPQPSRRDRDREVDMDPNNVQVDMFNSLNDINFDDDDNVLGWANDQLTNPSTNQSGLIGRLLPGGLLGVAKEARGIAEVNAAARVARARGNTELADELETRLGAFNSVAKRMLPSEWIDGDQIASNYLAREDNTPSKKKGDDRQQNRPSGLPKADKETKSGGNKDDFMSSISS